MQKRKQKLEGGRAAVLRYNTCVFYERPSLPFLKQPPP